MADLTPHAFAEKWAKSRLSERSSYQQHFLDLCRMLGQPTLADLDPEGDFYTFEKGVEKSGGGKGFADVWRKGRFAIEYKGRHKDLKAALSQLQQYQGALGNPPLLMVTDTERYEVHTTFTDVVTETFEFTNEELPQPENLRVLREMFNDPAALKPTRTIQSVTEEAAGKFARIADGVRARGVDPQKAAHFLNRLLFCLFVEDVGLLPKKLFERVAERGVKTPETFNRNIGELFGAMATGGEFSLEDVLHFNGGLFADAEVVALETDELRVLLEAARLDWGSVDPAIFGTLFERSLDPAQRAKLGAHYTSREDILEVVEPVLMAPLRREWEEVRKNAGAEAEKAGTLSGRTAANNALGRAEKMLLDFAERLRKVRVLDPACGSGNFLTVSLRLLQDLEQDVLDFAREIGLTPFFPEVGPEQLLGIETSPYAHELAQVAIWIAYLQWRMEYGYGPGPEPILGPMTNIVEIDAILARDEDGILSEPEWPDADVIVGNPPFLGGKRLRAELGDDYVESLFTLYKGRVPRRADLVTYWFERARAGVAAGRYKRAGLLATNSIRQQQNRPVIDAIKESGDIFMAWSDRPWVLEGAAVQVSIIGFDNGSEQGRTLDGIPANEINADLTGTVGFTNARPLSENSDICLRADEKGGPFDIPNNVAQEMLRAPFNVNGRPNSDVVRPWITALDVTRRPRNMWIIDFGVDMSEEDAALFELPFQYVEQHVKPVRLLNNMPRLRNKWWLHRIPGANMRSKLSKLRRYVVTPVTSKYRLFAWVDSATLPDITVSVFAREDDYFFGVLHSRAHELWALRMGTSLEDRPRYTPTTCFETFPFPEPTDEQREEIASAARPLDELRGNWLNPEGASEAELKKRTLTNLYNARPTWLANAHAALDRAVFAAYGWPEEIDDEEILKNLLALNLERSS